ncbi:MAG: hypothetical protein JWQ71_750 [Pedosphaera sp.]|nr:hypothetical protein [Pedosphaera sp.]
MIGDAAVAKEGVAVDGADDEDCPGIDFVDVGAGVESIGHVGGCKMLEVRRWFFRRILRAEQKPGIR